MQTTRTSAVTDPPWAQALFNDTRFAWVWLIARVYLGRQWFTEGLDKAQTPGWIGGHAGTFLTTWVTRALTKTQGHTPTSKTGMGRSWRTSTPLCGAISSRSARSSSAWD